MRLFTQKFSASTVESMNTYIAYLGGQKHGQKAWGDLNTLPERGEGGEYRHLFSFGFGACDPAGPYPATASFSVTWVADS